MTDRDTLMQFRPNVAMTKANDCLGCCVAYTLDLPREALPEIDAEGAWDESWKALSDSLLERGWWFWMAEFPEAEKPNLAALTRDWGPVRYLWIVSVSHPSWPDEWAHAMVMHGGRIAFDPARDAGPERPPKRELSVNGRFYFTPLDPAEMRRGT